MAARLTLASIVAASSLVLSTVPTSSAKAAIIDDLVRDGVSLVRKMFRSTPKRSEILIGATSIAIGGLYIYLSDVNKALASIDLQLSGESEIDHEFLRDLMIEKSQDSSEMTVRVCEKPDGSLFPAPSWYEICPLSGEPPILYRKDFDISKVPLRDNELD